MTITTLKNKVIVITGASRGIGAAMAKRFACDGAKIAILAKTSEPHPTLKGTIYSVAEEIRDRGGEALPLVVDVRSGDEISPAIAKVVETWGALDILVNNASAISLTPTAKTSLKRFDLMMSVNTRATFACSQACIPHLIKSENPHILNLSPPLNPDSHWFAPHVAYAISKYGMSFCTLGMAAEFSASGIAVNSLWPKTTIATAAIEVHFPNEIYQRSRKPDIVADAAWFIVTKPSQSFTGKFLIDESVLREEGIEDFTHYALTPDLPLQRDLFVDPLK